MQYRPSRQRDLFEPVKPPVALEPADRLKLVALVQALLSEIVNQRPSTSIEEVGNDQAHA